MLLFYPAVASWMLNQEGQKSTLAMSVLIVLHLLSKQFFLLFTATINSRRNNLTTSTTNLIIQSSFLSLCTVPQQFMRFIIVVLCIPLWGNKNYVGECGWERKVKLIKRVCEYCPWCFRYLNVALISNIEFICLFGIKNPTFLQCDGVVRAKKDPMRHACLRMLIINNY